MKRLAKITTMLAVYLVWVFGNSVIALSCHANHDKHIHCCTKSCDCCHHEDWERVHFESPHGCHHDHSNKITLYDTTKDNEIDIKPTVSTIHSYLLSPISYLLAPISSLLYPRYYKRSESLPPSPTLSWHSLRAPPVIA